MRLTYTGVYAVYTEHLQYTVFGFVVRASRGVALSGPGLNDLCTVNRPSSICLIIKTLPDLSLQQ
jgi:hypothetical protein